MTNQSERSLTLPITSLGNAIRWLERNNIQVIFGVGSYYISEVVAEGVMIDAQGENLIGVTNEYRDKYLKFLESSQVDLVKTVENALYDGEMANG